MVRSVRSPLSVLWMFVGLAWLAAGPAEAQDESPGKVKAANPPVPPAANQAPADQSIGLAQAAQAAGRAPTIAPPSHSPARTVSERAGR